MNDIPRQVLRRIVAKYGKDLGGDARRCEGLLKDFCGEYTREVNVLTSAAKERVPLDLLAAGSSMPHELLLTKLAKRLEDNLGLMPEAAHWAVNSWAIALGVVTEKEIEENEKKYADVIPGSIAKQHLPISPNSEIQPPSQNRPSQTIPPIQSPQNRVPSSKSPIDIPTQASHQPNQTRNSNIKVPQNSPPSNAPSVSLPPKKYMRKILGCLFALFLLIMTAAVLIFGVPYAISVMRETQRQSEPPRFPVR